MRKPQVTPTMEIKPHFQAVGETGWQPCNAGTRMSRPNASPPPATDRSHLHIGEMSPTKKCATPPPTQTYTTAASERGAAPNRVSDCFTWRPKTHLLQKGYPGNIKEQPRDQQWRRYARRPLPWSRQRGGARQQDAPPHHNLSEVCHSRTTPREARSHCGRDCRHSSRPARRLQPAGSQTYRRARAHAQLGWRQ